MTLKELKEAQIRREEWNKQVRAGTTVDNSESNADKLKRIRRLRNDYAAFVKYYFPHWCTDKDTGKLIPSAKFHIDAANRIRKTRQLKAVFKWARGHAKSTHMDVFIPMFLKCQEKREINVMVLIGKSQDNANTLLADIQSELEYNRRYIADFGKQKKEGDWTTGFFVTTDDCAFFALGRGRSPRGLRYRENRPDYIVIDDLDDDESCLNQSRVNKMTDWVKEALFGCFGAAGGRFIMVGNLINQCSVLANISVTEGVYVTQVNVRNAHGLPSWPELWPEFRIAEKEKFMGFRSFQKEYMNNPIIEGTVFTEMIFGRVPPLNRFRFLIGYGDPAPANSKDGKGSFKALFLVGCVDGVYYVIKGFLDHVTNAEFVEWYYVLRDYAGDKTQVYNYIENNTLQNPFYEQVFIPLFAEKAKTKGFVGIIPDERKKPDKFSRIEGNLEPLNRLGKLIFNEAEKDNPHMKRLMEQFLLLNPQMRSPADGPDCIEGGVFICNQKLSALMPVAYSIGQRGQYGNKRF
jgi:hypothetical protein